MKINPELLSAFCSTFLSLLLLVAGVVIPGVTGVVGAPSLLFLGFLTFLIFLFGVKSEKAGFGFAGGVAFTADDGV